MLTRIEKKRISDPLSIGTFLLLPSAPLLFAVPHVVATAFLSMVRPRTLVSPGAVAAAALQGLVQPLPAVLRYMAYVVPPWDWSLLALIVSQGHRGGPTYVCSGMCTASIWIYSDLICMSDVDLAIP